MRQGDRARRSQSTIDTVRELEGGKPVFLHLYPYPTRHFLLLSKYVTLFRERGLSLSIRYPRARVTAIGGLIYQK